MTEQEYQGAIQTKLQLTPGGFVPNSPVLIYYDNTGFAWAVTSPIRLTPDQRREAYNVLRMKMIAKYGTR